MTTEIKIRGDLAANWTSTDPVLGGREIGLETDTLKFKAGDGVTLWSALNYYSGRLAQVTRSQNFGVLTGTTPIPFDDTKPQNTEGDQYLSVSITPTDALNKLLVLINVNFGVSGANWAQIALFRDAEVDAVAVSSEYVAGANHTVTMGIRVGLNADSTTLQTYKLRIGVNGSGTITLNGANGSRRFGGASSSSIQIFEYQA